MRAGKSVTGRERAGTGLGRSLKRVDFLRERTTRNQKLHNILRATEGPRLGGARGRIRARNQPSRSAGEVLRSAPKCVRTVGSGAAPPSGSQRFGRFSYTRPSLPNLARWLPANNDFPQRCRNQSLAAAKNSPPRRERGRTVREGGLRDFPAANSFAPGGGRVNARGLSSRRPEDSPPVRTRGSGAGAARARAYPAPARGRRCSPPRRR